jgi:hypothetical protein
MSATIDLTKQTGMVIHGFRPSMMDVAADIFHRYDAAGGRVLDVKRIKDKLTVARHVLSFFTYEERGEILRSMLKRGTIQMRNEYELYEALELFD